jgi:hypothetical protein
MNLKIKELNETILPKLEKKFALKFDLGLFSYSFKLHSRHLALINNDLDLFCRKLGLKINVKDIKNNEYLLVLDNSKGYNHIESETKEHNEQITNGIINVCLEAKEGFTFKKTYKEIINIKNIQDEEKITLKIINDNLMKQQELMAYHLNVIKDLKREVEILKYK